MDVSNASMYDGGTALAEASILAGVQTRRGEVVLSAGVHPEYRQVLATESAGYGPRPRTVGLRAGAATDLDALRPPSATTRRPSSSSSRTSSARLEDLPAVAELAHAAGALLVVVADPVSLGAARGARQARRRHRRRRGAGARQRHELRRPRPRLHGRHHQAHAPHPRPPGRRDRRPRGPARLRAHAADARAAHPPREGHEQHLLQPRAQRAGHARLPELAGQARACPSSACTARARPPTCASACWRSRAWRPSPRAPCSASSPCGCRGRRPRWSTRWCRRASWPACPRAASPASSTGELARRRPARGRHREAHARRARRLRRRARPRPRERGGGPWLSAATRP